MTHDLKKMWQELPNTEALSNILGIHERTVVRNLKRAGIHVPSKVKQKEMTLFRIGKHITPRILPQAVWVKPEYNAEALMNDAVDTVTDMRICVRLGIEGASGWRIDIRGVHLFSEYLLALCLSDDLQLISAFYIPCVELRGHKFFTIPKEGREKIEPFKIKLDETYLFRGKSDSRKHMQFLRNSVESYLLMGEPKERPVGIFASDTD